LEAFIGKDFTLFKEMELWHIENWMKHLGQHFLLSLGDEGEGQSILVVG
jgi:hypothetical protein